MSKSLHLARHTHGATTVPPADTPGDDMQYMLLIYRDEAAMQPRHPRPDERDDRRLHGLRHRPPRGRRPARRRPPRPIRHRHHRAHRRRQDPGARRAVRRDQGAARRLLSDRRARPRRRARLGRPLPGSQQRLRRGPSDLGDADAAEGDEPAHLTAEAVARRAATASSSPSSPRARAMSPPPRTRCPKPSPRRWPTGPPAASRARRKPG